MTQYIDDTQTLINIIKSIENKPFIAIDTEFIRESTYFSKLCLIQIATEDISFAIDPLKNEIDLNPLWELLNEKDPIKVMHSGRQDMEIFYNKTNKLPTPVYDTQVAAMVCGFGDQVGYDQLVKKLLNVDIDKSSRVSDWSYRPLSDKQISYAISDVTYLAKAYKILNNEILKNNRSHWIEKEMLNFTNIKNYQTNPDEAWKKIKLRTSKRDFLNRVKFLATWRELLSIKKNITKNRLIRDDCLLDLASTNPRSILEFKRIRGFPGGQNGKLIPEILSVLKEANSISEDNWPMLDNKKYKKLTSASTLELLKVLLKYISEKNNVAPKLLASQSELELLSLGEYRKISILKDWRYEIFGKYALDLCNGNLSLSLEKNKIKLIKLSNKSIPD